MSSTYITELVHPGGVWFLGVVVALYHGLLAGVDPAVLRLPRVPQGLLLSFVQRLHVDRYHRHGVVVLGAVRVPTLWVLAGRKHRIV